VLWWAFERTIAAHRAMNLSVRGEDARASPGRESETAAEVMVASAYAQNLVVCLRRDPRVAAFRIARRSKTDNGSARSMAERAEDWPAITNLGV
jgi:hypothetical protein